MSNKVFWIVALLLLMGCKSSKKHHNQDVKFFPVLSYLKGQALGMDTSMARIMKIEIKDNKSDTSYIKREDFKIYANDFLNIPDIGSSKWKDDYEELQMNDDDQKKYILTYTTSEKNNEIQREDVMIDPMPDENGNNQVKTIIIDKWLTEDGNSIHKNMVWEANNRFLIVTKTQKQNQPEKISTLEVIWTNLPG